MDWFVGYFFHPDNRDLEICQEQREDPHRTGSWCLSRTADTGNPHKNVFEFYSFLPFFLVHFFKRLDCGNMDAVLWYSWNSFRRKFVELVECLNKRLAVKQASFPRSLYLHCVDMATKYITVCGSFSTSANLTKEAFPEHPFGIFSTK